MKKYILFLIPLMLAFCLVLGCSERSTTYSDENVVIDDNDDDDTDTPVAATGAFRLLVSDEEDVIGDFDELWLTLSEIGVFKNGESGGWIRMPPAAAQVDLRRLTGEQAVVIWSGNLPAGEYTETSIAIKAIKGVLTGGDEIEQQAESKLRISKSFTIAADAETNFVFDMAPIRDDDGNYALRARPEQSGWDRDFVEVENTTPPDDPDEDNDNGPLVLLLEGEMIAGEPVSLTVSDENGPVADALVTVNGEVLGQTATDGTFDFNLPAGIEEVQIRVDSDDREGELDMPVEEPDPANTSYEGEIISLPAGGPLSGPWMIRFDGRTNQTSVAVIAFEGAPEVGARVALREGHVMDEDLTAIINAEVEILPWWEQK